MKQRSGARAMVVLAVAGLHLGVLLVWSTALKPHRSAATPVRVSLRWLPPPTPRAAPPTPPATPAAPTTATPPRPGRVVRQAPSTPKPAPRITLPLPTTPVDLAATPAADAAAQAHAASAAPRRSLLDSEATRRAVHSAASAHGLAGLGDERAGNEPVSTGQQLAGAVQRSAKGDCVKGDYFGTGMGLLSVPFLAAAVLRDQCSR